MLKNSCPMPEKILITGASGFVGSSLVNRIRSRHPDLLLETMDIKDGDIADTAIRSVEVDHVIHLAARIFVPDSWKEPASFYRTNVQGTNNVLNYCRENGASMIYISSYVYGAPEYLPIDEKHPLSANNPYMHSKLLAESLCRFYAEHYGMNVSILRPFNLFGPNQGGHLLIPSLITQILDPSKKVVSVKDLNPKRDYIYIDNLLDAMMTLLQKHTGFCIYNVGSGHSYSVGEVIELLMELSGIRKEIRSREEERQNEIMDVRADINRIREEIGWEPGIPFREGLKRTIEHFQQHGM